MGGAGEVVTKDSQTGMEGEQARQSSPPLLSLSWPLALRVEGKADWFRTRIK